MVAEEVPPVAGAPAQSEGPKAGRIAVQQHPAGGLGVSPSGAPIATSPCTSQASVAVPIESRHPGSHSASTMDNSLPADPLLPHQPPAQPDTVTLTQNPRRLTRPELASRRSHTWIVMAGS